MLARSSPQLGLFNVAKSHGLVIYPIECDTWHRSWAVLPLADLHAVQRRAYAL